MADGRRAMAAKQYDKALESFRAAQRLMPGDQAAVQFAHEALTAKNAADKALFDKAMQQKKAADLANALTKVRTAIAAGKFDEAAAALQVALKIDPNNFDVKRAQLDIDRAVAARNTAQADAMKRQQEFNSLLTKARAALTAKRFDEAVQAATQAVQLQPSNQQARDLLASATKARDDAQRAMSAAEAQAKLKKLLDDANAAILAKRYDDADKLLAEAAKLSPNDTSVAKAQTALRNARQAMSTAEAEAKRRQQAYDTAMAAARSALQAKRYDDALKSVTVALQQMPNDKAALALRTQIEDARKSALAMEAKREFGRLMLQARTAFAGKKYDEALKLVQDALKLIPNDAEALKLQADITKAKQSPPMPSPMPKQPPAAYTKQMEAGASLESKLQYAQALTAYQAALRSLPGDDKASKKVDFCQNMAEGQRALAGKKFAVAVKEFEAALKTFPNDANAKQLLQQAKKGK
jgi:tetratricopeptide (TPR) repeat protein